MYDSYNSHNSRLGVDKILTWFGSMWFIQSHYENCPKLSALLARPSTKFAAWSTSRFSFKVMRSLNGPDGYYRFFKGLIGTVVYFWIVLMDITVFLRVWTGQLCTSEGSKRALQVLKGPLRSERVQMFYNITDGWWRILNCPEMSQRILKGLRDLEGSWRVFKDVVGSWRVLVSGALF